MGRVFQTALSRMAARAVGWRFARPIARAVLAAAGLALLAFVGRSAVAGALSGPSATPASPDTSAARWASSVPTPPAPSPAIAPPRSADAPSQALTAPRSADAPSGSQVETIRSRAPASPTDPVILNSAVESDLRRLPGIGAKRSEAILALRARMGRFRAIEDLLKVKGIGRATLKRLRPLLLVDAPPQVSTAPHSADAPSDGGPAPLPH